MQLPPDLRAAIDQRIQAWPAKTLAGTVTDLSQRYRSSRGSGEERFVRTDEEAVAYALFRMPATFAAALAVFEEVRRLQPTWRPRTFLDAGAGPGTAMWAAATVFPEIEQFTLIERESSMISFGQGLAYQSDRSPLKQAIWKKQDVTGAWKADRHDVVVSAYVLGELPENRRWPFVEKLWQLTLGTLVLIEPGTPDGFGRIRALRERLLQGKAHMIAPCPHGGTCPIVENDWCHFSRRLDRSRLHRQVKSGALSYEDEKYSYVAVSHIPGAVINGRILRHPTKRKGHIGLEVCAPDGAIHSVNVTRKDREAFRQARSSRWGDEAPGVVENQPAD